MKKFIATGHVGNMKLTIEDTVKEIPVMRIDCPHYTYCVTKNFGRINCISKSNIDSCQTYRFYEKYGEDYNLQGI